jgi:nucleoside phosphorylase
MMATKIISLNPDVDLILGVGTAGSMALNLKAGDVTVANETIIGDWREEDGSGWRTAAYGSFDYGQPSEKVEKMVIRSTSPLILKFLAAFDADCPRVRTFSSDLFVGGKELKLQLGQLFGCQICEMEAGALAHVARRSGRVPWLQIRVVADTLDDALADYFRIEKDMVQILGAKVLAAIQLLDENWTAFAS